MFNMETRIKTFRYKVYTDTEEIDAEINEFIKENVAELVELKTTVITINETNIDIIYTLIYRA